MGVDDEIELDGYSLVLNQASLNTFERKNIIQGSQGHVRGVIPSPLDGRFSHSVIFLQGHGKSIRACFKYVKLLTRHFAYWVHRSN